MEPKRKKELESSEAEDPGPSSRSLSKHDIHADPLRANGTSAKQVAPESPSFLQFIGNLFKGADAREGIDDNQAIALKDALEELLLEHAHASDAPLILPEERKMLNNILRFGEMSVSDVMIPRMNIVAIDYLSTLDDIKRSYIEYQHSRIPVYKDTLDTVEGYIHIKDLAVQTFSGKESEFSMDGVLRQLLFVPPSMSVLDLLMKMRLQSVHIAIVVDEYGGTDGLVTMEDIVEEIVGEIQDEHDEIDEQNQVVWVGDSSFEADARLNIHRVDECFGHNIVVQDEDDEFDTLGGLIVTKLGRVPETGESADLPCGLHVHILEADPRSVKRVRVSLSENS